MHTRRKGGFIPDGLGGNPEGMIGLSLGFQPQEHASNRNTPCLSALVSGTREEGGKGRKIVSYRVASKEPRIYRHLRGGTFFLSYLGLKPQAAVATLWRTLVIRFSEPNRLAATKALRSRVESYYPSGIDNYGPKIEPDRISSLTLT
jgi:hypothetical protein